MLVHPLATASEMTLRWQLPAREGYDMTRTTSARIAGFTFLFYIAVAFPSLVLMQRATSAAGTAAQLARIAEHASDVQLAILLTLLSCFSAIVLAVTLYGITRDVNQELAVATFAFRGGRFRSKKREIVCR
jgi:hypothetical protein